MAPKAPCDLSPACPTPLVSSHLPHLTCVRCEAPATPQGTVSPGCSGSASPYSHPSLMPSFTHHLFALSICFPFTVCITMCTHTCVFMVVFTWPTHTHTRSKAVSSKSTSTVPHKAPKEPQCLLHSTCSINIADSQWQRNLFWLMTAGKREF